MVTKGVPSKTSHPEAVGAFKDDTKYAEVTYDKKSMRLLSKAMAYGIMFTIALPVVAAVFERNEDNVEAETRTTR